MPRENINDLTNPDLRTEVSWDKAAGYIQVATTNRNYHPALTLADGPFDGWHVTYSNRASVNREIAVLIRARDEAFGREGLGADEVTAEKALTEAARLLARAGSGSQSPESNHAIVQVAHAWMTLARELPTP